jgi:hypothetical protein
MSALASPRRYLTVFLPSPPLLELPKLMFPLPAVISNTLEPKLLPLRL